jgi:hypothetical protein
VTVKAHFVTPTGALRASATMIILLITVGMLAFFTISYVAHGLRKICGLIVLIDDRNQAQPPTTDPDTVKFRTELHNYRNSIGC